MKHMCFSLPFDAFNHYYCYTFPTRHDVVYCVLVFDYTIYVLWFTLSNIALRWWIYENKINCHGQIIVIFCKGMFEFPEVCKVNIAL